MPAWMGSRFSPVPKGNGELFTPGCPCSVCCSCNSRFGIQELEAIKAKLREIEKEDERLKELQLEAENHLFMSSEAGMGYPLGMLSLPSWRTQGDNWSHSIWLCLSGHLGLDM